jgi:2'-5' RNA ligase
MTAPAAELRLFVAIELPQAVLDALRRLQSELRARGLEPLRWVRPEGIHLTLKFLGETPAERVPDIAQALEQAAKGVPPHDLSLGPLGTFGSRGSPRVLWVDLAGDLEPLRRLQERIEKSLAQIGFPKEGRPFSAHLTLARVPPEAARGLAGRLAEAVQRVKGPPGHIPVREVSLMRSQPGPGGAVYTCLHSVPLT